MRSISDRARRTGIATAYRFVSGHHLDGLHRTDAGWITRGTRSVVPGGRVSRWSILPRAARAGIRLGTAAAAGAAGWGYLQHPEGTEQTLTGAGAAVSLGAGYAAASWLADLRHRRDWVRPLHLALQGPLGVPDGTIPTAYIKIPRDYPERTDVGRIDLPADFTGSSGIPTSTVGTIVKTKLGLTDASVSFKLEGRRPHLMIRQTPRPPAKVLFVDEQVRQLVDAAREPAPLIGIGPRGRTVAVDLDAESPHVLVQAGTGGGKSVITRTMAVQMLHRGAQLVVLDVKRHSHRWARGLPNVAYFRDVADIHDALISLGEEGHRRNLIVDDWEGEDDPDVGPRLVVLCEEMNATRSRLKKYWAEIREKSDPKESPAVSSLAEVLFMGRAVKMNVLAVAQSATAQALGGPEMRENFATRILARYTRNAWMMLAPEVQPVPRSTRHVGRAQVVLGGAAAETQVVFFTEDEARDWAVSGTVAAAPDLGARPTVPGARVPVDLAKQPETVPGRHLAAVPSAPAPVGLAAAVRDGILTVTLASARAARQRDPEFPAPAGTRGQEKLYDPEALRSWERNRPGNVGAAG